ncbi:MAG: NAD-dependent deacetylase [Firmicutes bacterium]|jgi:NAD-dependent SIR2 family protein deacetylase|nr:NAD-dependent deacetylase [Bacillota bacterium]
MDVGIRQSFQDAARAIKNARTLVITAGAGMGVDSGLPDYRGEKGFWKCYPMYEPLGLNYYDAANPMHFEEDPAFGWGFYAHRIDLYRKTTPHQGFQLLLKWISRFEMDHFVITSNVDGQFQKAGFSSEKVYEVHGSIHYLQCTRPCSSAIWENKEDIPVDLSTMRAKKILRCPHCGNVSRPNVLMFGDFTWLSERSDEQSRNYGSFLKKYTPPMVVVEMGAGTAISTIRNMSESLGKHHKALIIRINPRDYRISPPHISIPCGALEGLQGINKQLNSEEN